MALMLIKSYQLPALQLTTSSLTPRYKGLRWEQRHFVFKARLSALDKHTHLHRSSDTQLEAHTKCSSDVRTAAVETTIGNNCFDCENVAVLHCALQCCIVYYCDDDDVCIE